MINKASEHFVKGPTLSDLFEPRGSGHDWADLMLPFEVLPQEVYAWRMTNSARLSRAFRSENVSRINTGPIFDPIELFRLIASHAMIARSLICSLRTPAYWVRRGSPDGSERFVRPALPETQLSELLEAPTRQIGPALRPLLLDGAVEIVRSPSGVRAVLMADGFVEEDRFRARLRA